MTFWRDVGGVRQFVNIQRSTSSTASEVRFTVNLAVLCPKALASWEPEYSSASAPWQERIGFYGDAAEDKWWIATSEKEASVAAEEVLQMLDAALGAVEAIDSVSALIEVLQKDGTPVMLSLLGKEKYIGKLEALK